MARFGVTATVAALLCLAGCGGGGDGGSLSADYVKRANALCDEWTQALKDLGVSPPLGDTGRMVPFTRQQLAIDERFTARFKELNATESERAVLQPVYDAFEAVNLGEARVLDSAQRGDRAGIQTFHQNVEDTTKKMNVSLRKLKLRSCSG